MAMGHLKSEYFHDPDIQKPLEEIYADMDNFTYEVRREEEHLISTWLMHVILPPLQFEGRFVKGLAFSHTIDRVLEITPQIPRMFNLIANSMSASCAKTTQADAYFLLYNNPHRFEYLKKSRPDLINKTLLPLQDADVTNEYLFGPKIGQTVSRDVIIVSRLFYQKNLLLLIEAIQVYTKKYGRKLKVTHIMGKALDQLADSEKDVLKEYEVAIEPIKDQLEVLPLVNHFHELPTIYRESRVAILGSLYEGKNRFITEAMLSDTPVVCFKAFNQYIRGEDGAFPEGAGLYAPHFTAESMADTIHDVLTHQGDFHPRKALLSKMGRVGFFDTCLKSMPYYKEHIPDLDSGPPHRNQWLDQAVHLNYGISLIDFIFGKLNHLVDNRGADRIKVMLNDYWPMRSA